MLAVAVLIAVVLSACTTTGGTDSATGGGEVEWLFTLRADQAVMALDAEGRGRVELGDVDPTVVAFTDRPAHQAGTETVTSFAEKWADRFDGDPPQAALVSERPSETLVLEVERFTVSGGTATLDVRVVAEVPGAARAYLGSAPLEPAGPAGARRGITLFVDGADEGPAGQAATPARATPHLDAVVKELRKDNPTSEGIAWSRSSGNRLGAPGEVPDAWLLQTPGCWGRTSCDTASFTRFTGALRDITAGATTVVDLTTLYPFPDGEFRQALVDGLAAAHAAGKRPLIRVVAGVSPGGSAGGTSAGQWRDALVGDIAAKAGVDGGQIHLAVASVATSWGWSWNHAKIVAVDGAAAAIGGHNLWTADYLQTTNPINDVTVLHRGPVAADAHAFVDNEWGFVCANSGSATNVDYQPTAGVSACPATHPTLGPPKAVGDVEVLAIGRLGMGIDIPEVKAGPLPTDLVSKADANAAACSWFTNDYTNRDAPYERDNPGEPALRALIASATTSVTITQQDLIGLCSAKLVPKWDVRVFDALADRVAAGVEVRIVLSSPGTHDYSNGGTLADVSSYLLSRLTAKVGDAAAARRQFCAQVGIAPLRFNDTMDAWPGGQLIGNHTKVVAVDRQAFYVGSQNLYPAWLQEHGVIVEDAAAAETFYGQLLDPMWKHSQRVKDTSQCG